VRTRVESGLVGALLVAAVTLGAATVGWASVPHWLVQSAKYVGFEQAWTMYAPHPPIFDLDFRVLGHTPGGEILTLVGSSDDVSHGGAWDEIVEFHAGYRIKDHLEHLMFLGKEADPLRQSYLDWVCRSWNELHPNRPISNAAFVALSRRTLTARSSREEPRMLAERACSAAAL
jgi:hypothetical protein